jgi:putative endonuclease
MTQTHIAWVYIMTNETNTTLYVGSTVEISSRMWEHRTKMNPGSFTARYKICKLVYYRGYHSVESARLEEKYIKGKSRGWKIALINRTNPDWDDLTEQASRV